MTKPIARAEPPGYGVTMTGLSKRRFSPTKALSRSRVLRVEQPHEGQALEHRLERRQHAARQEARREESEQRDEDDRRDEADAGMGRPSQPSIVMNTRTHT